MAEKQVWIGSEGPFLFDDSDTYSDGVNHTGLRSETAIEIPNVKVSSFGGASRIVKSTSGKELAEVTDLTAWIAGGTGISSVDDGDGTLTLNVSSVLGSLIDLGDPTADGQFIVATGVGAFAYESGATARTSIGLGASNSPTFAGLTSTGDVIIDSPAGSDAIYRLKEDGADKIDFFWDASESLYRLFDNVNDQNIYNYDPATKRLTFKRFFTFGLGLTSTGNISATGQSLTIGDVAIGTTLTSGNVLTVGGAMDVQDVLQTDNFSAGSTGWQISYAGAIDVRSINEAAVTAHEGAIDHNALTNYVANEHVDHSSVSISAGTGLSGGGDLTATRTLNVNIPGLAALASGLVSTDELIVSDAGTHKRMDVSVLESYMQSNLTFTTDNNDYLTGLSFATGTGILTATVQNQTNPTVDLDGRYSLQGHTHTKDDITDFAPVFDEVGNVLDDNQRVMFSLGADEKAYLFILVSAVGSDSLTTRAEFLIESAGASIEQHSDNTNTFVGNVGSPNGSLNGTDGQSNVWIDSSDDVWIHNREGGARDYFFFVIRQ